MRVKKSRHFVPNGKGWNRHLVVESARKFDLVSFQSTECRMTVTFAQYSPLFFEFNFQFRAVLHLRVLDHRPRDVSSFSV